MIFVYVPSTWRKVELNGLETWITRNNVNGVIFFHLSYLMTLMAYLCFQWAPNDQIKYFMLDLSIYRLFVLNRGWKRNSLQITIFVCFLDMKHSWTKNAFWVANNRKWCKWCKFVLPFLLNNSYGFHVLTIDSKRPNHVVYVWLVDLRTISAK
jgi:hypothetical protein